MANQNGRIPLTVGKKICEENHLTQVVVIGKSVSGAQVCMTYGVTLKDCENAAIAGRFWERVIGLGTKCDAVKAIRGLLSELEAESKEKTNKG